MIPMLLWRCPLCATNDALVHRKGFIGEGVVHCRCCAARWRVRRVPGDDFYLTLRGGPERRLSAWYDLMKETVRLTPIHEAAVTLEPGEDLYLVSGPAQLEAEEGDSLFFPHGNPVPSRVEKAAIRGLVAGHGRLFLTSRRLIWLPQPRGEDTAVAPVSFPLTQVNSAYAVMDFSLLLLIGLRLYAVYFAQESILKWVHYIALVAHCIQAETGHRLTTSHY